MAARGLVNGRDGLQRMSCGHSCQSSRALARRIGPAPQEWEGFSFSTHPSPSEICMLSYYIHFIDKPLRSTELVHDEENITDIDIDTSLEIRLEHHVAAH